MRAALLRTLIAMGAAFRVQKACIIIDCDDIKLIFTFRWLGKHEIWRVNDAFAVTSKNADSS